MTPSYFLLERTTTIVANGPAGDSESIADTDVRYVLGCWDGVMRAIREHRRSSRSTTDAARVFTRSDADAAQPSANAEPESLSSDCDWGSMGPVS